MPSQGTRAALGGSRSSLDYMGLAFAYYLDFTTKRFIEQTVMAPLGAGCHLPPEVGADVTFANRAMSHRRRAVGRRVDRRHVRPVRLFARPWTIRTALSGQVDLVFRPFPSGSPSRTSSWSGPRCTSSSGATKAGLPLTAARPSASTGWSAGPKSATPAAGRPGASRLAAIRRRARPGPSPAAGSPGCGPKQRSAPCDGIRG